MALEASLEVADEHSLSDAPRSEGVLRADALLVQSQCPFRWVRAAVAPAGCAQPRKENTQCVLYSDPDQRVLHAFFTRFFLT